MILQTDRLLLRTIDEADAEGLFEYAKDPEVGPIAGWPPHKSVKETRKVIRDVLSGPECYAICRKVDGSVIGVIELKLRGRTDLTDQKDECELGYWLGRPFWGQELMPEAVRELLRYAFEELGMKKIWAGYYEGNDRSRRVQEKCGFRHVRTTENVEVPLLHETRRGHVSCLTREDWDELEDAAEQAEPSGVI